jgi:hypothetical protein
MSSIEQKHLEHIHNMQALDETMKWYGWGSPIGLSIFLLTLIAIVYIIIALIIPLFK